MTTTRVFELINLTREMQSNYNRVLEERDTVKRLLLESQELHFKLSQKHKDLMASYGDMFQAARKANSALVANGAAPVILPSRRKSEG